MSIRDALEEAVNTAESEPSAPATPAVEAPVEQTEVHAEAPQETAEQKAGRTAGRARDEHGRLLPGKAEKQETTGSPSEPAKPKINPPSSWKKDFWGDFEKISTERPQLAEYLNQREAEFTKGVSTYKQEYDRVQPLVQAVQQFAPEFQRLGIRPEQAITNLMMSDRALRHGTPQEKLQKFAVLAQEYGVPLQALYDPQVQQQFLAQQQLAPQTQQPDVRQLVQEQLTEVFAKQDLQQFQSAKNADGTPKYPHYETVRNTMAQLLDANLASDLQTAYDKAIRMHDDIWQQEQSAKQAASQKTAQVAQARQVAQAKAAAVSPRTATPGAATAQATKGIRASVEAAFDAHATNGDRV